MVKCAVPNCQLRANRITVHRFPHNSVIGQLWIQAIGKNELSKIPYEELRRKSLGVCKIHFTDDSYLKQTNRPALKDSAVPSILLPCLFENTDSNTIDASDTSQNVTSNISFTLQELKEGTMSPRMTYKSHVKSPHIRKSISMNIDEETSPKFRSATYQSPKFKNLSKCSESTTTLAVKKRPREEEEQEYEERQFLLNASTSTPKRRRMNRSFTSSPSTSFKRIFEENHVITPKSEKRKSSVNLSERMERMETEDVKKVKNYMAFRSHSSNMDMTPRAKKIFEAAKTVKKQLY